MRDPALKSVELLHSAVQKIQDAIGQDNLIALEGQRDTLAIQFGKVMKLSAFDPKFLDILACPRTRGR